MSAFLNLRKSPRQPRIANYFKPSLGPDDKWKDHSPFKTFDIETEALKDVVDHKLYHKEQQKDYERSVVFGQRNIFNFNRIIKDVASCKKHRIGINRMGHLAKGVLQLLEADQQVLKNTLIAYEDCIHDYEDLQRKYSMLVRQLEDLGEVPVVGGGSENPSQGEAENWSPQRNVNLETSFNGGAHSVAAAPSPSMGYVGDDDKDSDGTVPLTPSPGIKRQPLPRVYPASHWRP